MLIIAIATIIIAIGFGIYIKVFKEKDEPLGDIDRISKILTTTRKTDIFIVGKEIDFNNKVSTTNIDEVTASTINGSGDYKVIIVNDLDDKVNLSDDEIGFLDELISKDGYMLIYLGGKYSTTWDDPSYGIAGYENKKINQLSGGEQQYIKQTAKN